MALQPVPAIPPKDIRGRVAFTQSHDAYAFPAPTLGIDARQSLAAANPQTAVIIENMFARAFGLELRAGYVQHANISGVTGGGSTATGSAILTETADAGAFAGTRA